jgi:hypothetical protein
VTFVTRKPGVTFSGNRAEINPDIARGLKRGSHSKLRPIGGSAVVSGMDSGTTQSVT